MAMVADPDTNAVRGVLKARGFDALVALQGKVPPRPVSVRAVLGLAELRMVYQQTNGEEHHHPGRPGGQFFSPLESAIWMSLADGQPRVGKRIAAECRQKFSGRFRVIIANLVDRGVLMQDGAGYRRAGPPVSHQ